MVVKSRQLIVLAPEHLAPAVAAALRRVPARRMDGRSRMLVVPAHAETAPVDADIVVMPTLASALRWAQRQHWHWPMAVRLASRLLAKLANAAARSDVTVIAEADLNTPGRVRRAIAGAIARSDSPTRLAGPRLGSRLPLPPFLSPRISPLRIYAELPVRRGAYAWWPYSQFVTDDFKTCPPVIDITGRSRRLIYGPYMVLPAGRWEACIVFDLCEAAARYDYLVEFGPRNKPTQLIYRPKTAGQQLVSLTHEVHDYSELEIRIKLLRAAFHGEIKLAGAWLKRIDEPRFSHPLLSKRRGGKPGHAGSGSPPANKRKRASDPKRGRKPARKRSPGPAKP